ncbi:fasciclin domain-containing protein [Chitinophaga sp. Cy-1792]|uniref:fasciclin domain-containing protein n=1 Tax=Chitinophaga sp. Cy-1792 TaxID=2608339 RepID=UPI00141EA977|nr:fasciclin domain-containing protein [Chitinophaga sp. Cy-1792]NIG57128.1 hypothetical protein [Chitinophaga sp. Cy-1792]
MKLSKIIYTLALVSVCWTACTQKDAQVSPVGKTIDYTGPGKTVRQILDSAKFTIYKAMWQKANMDSVITAGNYQGYTLLVPTDAAFTAAGITADKVKTMAVNDLDTILFYHTLNSWMPSANIQQLKGNASLRTLLTRSDIPTYSSWTPYVYYLFLGLHDKQLMVNGKAHPFTAMEGTNGTIYVLDEVLKQPNTDMIDYLKSNPNFTFLLEACRINDSIYQTVWGQQGFSQLLQASTRSAYITLFAPTNNAFKKAGFNTIDDLRQRALRYEVGWPNYDEHLYYRYTFTSLDTLLLAHHIDLTGVQPANYNMVIFTNDMLDNGAISNFTIDPGRAYNNPPQYVRLNFSANGNTIMVKETGSSVGALPLKSTDMMFRNGVLHIVDDGLFKQ